LKDVAAAAGLSVGMASRVLGEYGSFSARTRKKVLEAAARLNYRTNGVARSLRLNRSRGGRPPTKSRTLRAVEELVEFARAGRPGALDELRSIRALIGNT
jgi:hypothetical protein